MRRRFITLLVIILIAILLALFFFFWQSGSGKVSHAHTPVTISSATTIPTAQETATIIERIAI